MSRSLRVLALGTLYPPYAIGGYESVWRDTVATLREAGHQVRVLCSNWTGSDNGEPEDPDIRRELELYIDDLLDVRTEAREEVLERERRNRELLDGVLDELRPDVAFLGPGGGLPLSLLTRVHRRSIPQLAFVGDEWPRYGPKADPGQRLLRRRRALLGLRTRNPDAERRFRHSDVDRWVCGSERSAQVLRRVGADPATLVLLKPGPDTRRFTRRESHPWRGELLYAGRLHPDKGIEFAIRALADAPSCRLTIAGAGDPRYADKLGRIATELGVIDRVAMLGEQHDRLPELYVDADAVIFPSVWKEPWGLVPLEAMAVGRPVISTAVGGTSEYVRDGENSVIVEPRDPAAIAQAVDRLATDPALRSRLIEGGFVTAEEHRHDRFLGRLAAAVLELGGVASEMIENASALPARR